MFRPDEIRWEIIIGLHYQQLCLVGLRMAIVCLQALLITLSESLPLVHLT